MSDLVWWTLFSILVILLVVFTSKLCFRVISDIYCDNRDALSEESKDVEDLSRYRTDSRTICKDAEFSDEGDKIMMTKAFIPSRRNEESKTQSAPKDFDEKITENGMKVIHEEDEAKSEEVALNIEEDRVDAEERVDAKEEKPVKESQREDEAANLTEAEKKILEEIQGIQGEVDIYAKDIPYCFGGRNHLRYFEINQNFLMSLIRLSSIDCSDNEKLNKRKKMLSVYIQDRQNELKEKADESVL
jgi:hypothetical protein